ncbi:hypothetical protein D3C73_1502930 [compost metagenome]
MWVIGAHIKHPEIHDTGAYNGGDHTGSSQRFYCSFHVSPLEPHANTGYKSCLIGIVPFIAGQIGGFAV